MKRSIDILISALGVLVLWPVLLGIAIFVRLDSAGPILYRGVRAGRWGKPFRILKYRTMVTDAEKKGGGTTRLKDPRVTRVGKWLRKFKLDELPQLFNVLSGKMSLVGPRPELLQYTDAYTAEEREILRVRPGITDLASVEFHSLDKWVGAGDADRIYEETVLPRKNALRLKYARESSLALDFQILTRTAVVLVRKALGKDRSWNS